MVPEVAEGAAVATVVAIQEAPVVAIQEVTGQVTYPLLMVAHPTSRWHCGIHTRWATIRTGQIWNV